MGDNNWASLEYQNQSAENAKMIRPKYSRPKYIKGEKESTTNTIALTEYSKYYCFIPKKFLNCHSNKNAINIIVYIDGS